MNCACNCGIICLICYNVQVEMLSHFGTEHYCPLSLLRVHGSSMMEELEDHEIDGQEDNDNTDSESDSDVPVLPPEPGANVEKEPKQQNLLERAADTVINLVKKITGNGHDKEKGGDNTDEGDSKQDTLESSNRATVGASESQDESKDKIVTLVGHEELKENPEESNSRITGTEQGPSDNGSTSQGKPMSGNISSEDSSSCKGIDDERELEATSTAPSQCQLFSQLVGQYSLGCFMGRLLFSKNENFTLLMDVTKSWSMKHSNKTSPASDTKDKNEALANKVGDDQEEVPKQEVATQETPSDAESSEEKSTLSEDTNKKFSVVIPEPSSSNLEVKSESTVSSSSEVTETVDASIRIVQPSQLTDSVMAGKQSGTSDDKTPALAQESVVTSVPLNSSQSVSSPVMLQTSEVPVFKESPVDAVKEKPGADDQQGDNDQLVQQSLPNSQSTVLDGEHAMSITKDTANQPAVPLDWKDVTSESESEQREENISDKDKLNEDKEAKKTEPSPSDCRAPNSLHLMSQSSPDIDILETKLTDKEGREGTAQLPEEGNVESVNGASTSKIVTDSSSVNKESVDSGNKETSPELENRESSSESASSLTKVEESQSVDSTVKPTSPPSVDNPDLADSIVPLPAPPIMSDASVSSQEFAAAAAAVTAAASDANVDAAMLSKAQQAPAASDANLDAAMLSKAQQAAATSAGMASVAGSGGQKESIFVRLSNKIKTLEQNLNMSTLYMEQLHHR